MSVPEAVGRRRALLERLERETFDLLVLGGGSVGAGIALEAAARGLAVALVERADFASGASGRSTKLLHGGVRYLERAVTHLDLGEYRLVREALAERAALFRQAPHLCRPVAILTPVSSAWELRYYAAGLGLYDRLAGAQSLGATRVLDGAGARRAFPALAARRWAGAVCYLDGQFDDARFNVALVLTALELGAVAVNHLEATSLLWEGGRVAGALVREHPAGAELAVRARVVCNATGPFADAVRALAGASRPLVRPSSGVHLVLRAAICPPDTGLLVPRTPDGRVVFLLPWQGHTLVGTTDDPAEPTAHPPVRPEDVEYLLAQVGPYVERRLGPEDVASAWSGLRPLVRDPRRARTAQLSRTHVVHEEPAGLLTVAGGKWTTYRRIAADAVAHLGTLGIGLGPTPREPLPLVGGRRFSLAEALGACRTRGLPAEVAEHLASAYGDRVPEVLALGEGLLEPLVPGHPILRAEVVWAARREWAGTILDVLTRRTRLAMVDLRGARESVPEVARLLATELGWDRSRQEREESEALAELGGDL